MTPDPIFDAGLLLVILVGPMLAFVAIGQVLLDAFEHRGKPRR